MEKVIKKRVKPYYSAVLKRQVVREYESGYFTKEALSVKYGISGSNTVLEWQKKYSTLANQELEQESKIIEMKRKGIKGMKGKKDILETIAQSKPLRSAEQDRISELEKQLAQSRQREQIYLRVITLSSEQLGEDLLKKTGIGSLKT
jgi:transposase-like protein